MLSLSTSNKVTFNVNVSGTASTPVVRCLIGEYPTLSFPATKLSNGEYEVIIDLPADTKPGAHPFKIEVLLNGRLFTPINYSIDVNGDEAEVVPAPVEVPPVIAAPAPTSPKLVPMISKITEPEPGPDIPVPEAEADVDTPVPEEHTAKKPVALDPVITSSLWKLYDPMDMSFPDRGSEVEKLKYLQTLADRKPKKELGGLEKLTKTPVQKLKPRAKPAAEAAAAAPQKKFSMMDVANDVAKTKPPKAAPAKKAAVQEARAPALSVTLKKGAVIYKK